MNENLKRSEKPKIQLLIQKIRSSSEKQKSLSEKFRKLSDIDLDLIILQLWKVDLSMSPLSKNPLSAYPKSYVLASLITFRRGMYFVNKHGEPVLATKPSSKPRE